MRLSFPLKKLIDQLPLLGSVERGKIIRRIKLGKNFVDLPEFNLINNHIHIFNISLWILNLSRILLLILKVLYDRVIWKKFGTYGRKPSAEDTVVVQHGFILPVRSQLLFTHSFVTVLAYTSQFGKSPSLDFWEALFIIYGWVGGRGHFENLASPFYIKVCKAV